MQPFLVLTGNDSAMDLVGDLTAPNQEAYALRHGYDFERVREYEPGSHPSWQKLRLLKERLSDYRGILWLDADTLVTNPLSVARMEGRGFHVSTDWTWPAPEDAIKHFSLGNFYVDNCPGSFAVIEAALARWEWSNTPLWEQQAIQEEYRANEAIREHVHVYPRRTFNAVPATPNTTGPEPWEPGDWLCHFTYLPNEERARLMREIYMEQCHRAVIGWTLPTPYDTGMQIDLRHVAILRDILCGTYWGRVLEIGVWKGASTAGFIDASKNSSIAGYSACDVGFQPEFRQMATGLREPKEFLEMRSTEALDLDRDWDLIFVDGDHSLETGRAETERLLRRQPRCIVAHDVFSEAEGFGNCAGPAHLMASLRADGWTIYTDGVDRRDRREQTRRGLMAATKDAGTAKVIERAFALNTW